MEFIETSIFEKASKNLLTDDELHQLQMMLSLYPETGQIIPGSGGLRKFRWVYRKKGKRGGLRIIYYWVTAHHQIYLLYVYSKAKREDLTSEQIKVLRTLIEED